jgi:hypothetical protein
VEAQRLVTVSSAVELRPSSLQPVEPLTNQALAVAAGLLVGLGGLIIADRVRKPLWEATDVEGLPQLPEVAPRGRFDSLDAPWYVATLSLSRKAEIQALRATIEGVAQTGAAVVGVIGLQTKAEDVQELAADLATSIAASGNSVLLVDANLDHPSDLVEYGDGHINLSGLLLEAQLIDEAAGTPTQDLYDEKLAALSPVIPNLYGLAAGTEAANAPDIVARPHFALLIRDAAERFDVIIVSGAGIKSPITQVLSQRLGHMVVAAAAGRATESGVEIVRREYSDRKAKLLGVALLMNTPTYLGRRFWNFFRRTRESGFGASVPGWPLGRSSTRTTQPTTSAEAEASTEPPQATEPVLYYTRWRTPDDAGAPDGWTQGPDFNNVDAARTWAQGSTRLNSGSVVEIYTDEPTGARTIETIEASAPGISATRAVRSTAVEQVAAEKVAAQKAAEKVAAEKVAAEKVAAEKVAAEKVAAEKVAAEKVAAQKAAEKVAAEKVAAQKAAEQVAAEKVAAQKAAEKVAAEKVAAKRVAAERVAAKRAAEKAAAERAPAEKVPADRVAEKKVAAERAAAEKVPADRVAEKKVAAERGATERVAAAEKPAAEPAAKPAAKKAAAKPVAKKPAVKPVAKKKAAAKPVAKKPAAKKAAAKPVAKKPAAKKAAAKPVAKKPAAKPVAKKPVAKKPVAKKPVAKKPVAKKPATK